MKSRSPLLQLRNVMLVGFLALSSTAYAAPAATFTLEDNQLTISGGSGTTFSTQTATISSAGIVSTIANVPSTNGVGIPSFAFTLVPSNVPDGSYEFRVGVTIDDNANDRRMEAKIDKLTLTVAGTTVTGTIPAAGNALRVLGRDGGNTLQVALSTTNDQQSGPITVSGGTVSFNASTLIDRIRSSTTTSFDTYILKEFEQAATYTYHIAVQQLAGAPSTLNFGTTQPSFTPLPKVGVDVSSPATFSLNSSELATGFTSAPYVKGEFNVVYIAPSSSGGGGGTGGSSANVTQGTANLEQELASIPAISAGTPPSADTVAKVEAAVSNASTVAAQAAAAAAAGTLTPSQAIATLLQSNKAVELAGQAKQAGATSSASTSASVLSNIANVFSGLSSSGTTISDTQKAQLATEAKKAIDNAKSLIKEGDGGTTQAELIALVDAGAKLLNNMTKLNDNLVPDDVLTSINTLSSSAIGNSLQGVEAANGLDRSNPVAVRNFLQSNPAAKDKAVSNTPIIPPIVIIKTEFVLDNTTCTGDSEDFKQLVRQAYGNTLTTANTIEITFNECGNDGSASSLLSGGNLLAATTAPTIKVEDSGRFIYSTNSDKYVGRSIARLVPSSIPTGTSALPNGKTLLVQAGIATEVSPTALDEATFGAAVSGAGYQLSYNDNGSIAIDLGSNQSFSGAFAYNNVGTATSCGAVSFTAPAGSPTDADYAFIANCADGAAQRITPFAHANGFYTTLSSEGISATTDRNTGIVTIPNVGSFKPSFFVNPLSLNDTAYYNATKNTDGIAFRASDANGDGKTDYEIISATGVQLMYGL